MKSQTRLFLSIFFILFVIFLLHITKSYSQSRLVLNNDAYIVVSNSAYMVIDNAGASAISTAGTGGNIISEGENNRIKWNIGTGSGNYTIPYTNSSGSKMPLSINIATAGVGIGSFLFSSYAGSNWDNNTYRPSDVTQMFNKFGINNSTNVVDRFWIIDAAGYITKPTTSITFYYSDNDWNGVGNTIIESSLFAQRFNFSINTWGDWYGPFGTADIINNTVSTGSINPSDFYKSWTLVNESSPLPIELLSFNAHLIENKVELKWSTASEINNDYFTIEKSYDVIDWDVIGIIDGAGNSNQILNYQYLDTKLKGIQYYRLKQTDFDSKFEYSKIVSVNYSIDNILNTITYPNPTNGIFTVNIKGEEPENATIRVLTITGQIVSEKKERLSNYSSFDISNLASGIYYIEINQNGTVSRTKLVKN